MTEKRFLVVNADDFGLSSGVNAGIAEAHERGVVTSTSLMALRGSAGEAAAYAQQHPELAIGLHMDLDQCNDRTAVEAECRKQLDAFRELIGRDPTHLDSHRHTHMNEPVASIAVRLAAELDVPLRAHSLRYEGGFYGQTDRGAPLPEAISVKGLRELISALPTGWTELGCHPGRDMRGESSYSVEREREVEALCDPGVRKAIESGGIQLRSFAQFG